MKSSTEMDSAFILLLVCYLWHPYGFIYLQLLRKQIPLINGHGPICQSTGKIFNDVCARQTPEILK